MKYLIMIPLFACSVYTLKAQTKAGGTVKKDTKEEIAEAKKVFTESCVESAATGRDTVLAPLFKSYCSCAADKIFSKYSIKQVEDIFALGEEKALEKVNPLLKPCLEALQEKLKDVKVEEAPPMEPMK